MNNNALEVLQHKFVDLAQWISSLCRYNKLADFVIVDYKDEVLKLKIYTKDNKYTITAMLQCHRQFIKEKMIRDWDDGYLGCTIQSRKPRAGEDWTRGNDLPDGKYNIDTWKTIVNAIVAHELVKVVKSKTVRRVITSK